MQVPKALYTNVKRGLNMRMSTLMTSVYMHTTLVSTIYYIYIVVSKEAYTSVQEAYISVKNKACTSVRRGLY